MSEIYMNDNHYQTLALETYVQRSFNYYTNMVDASGVPYFNIFWTDPAEAAHDWPDSGDVTARQLQAVIMARHTTGVELPIEKVWRQKILAQLNPQTGLIHRPDTHYSQGDEGVSVIGDQALTLYALVTAYLDNGDAALRGAIQKMLEGLQQQYEDTKGAVSALTHGFIIKSLMVCARLMPSDLALHLAQSLVKKIFADPQIFPSTNTFPRGAHTHTYLRTLVGAADYAIYTNDANLYNRVEALYRHVKSMTTRFGFLPEVMERQGDIVSCETCTIMDYLGLAVTLANHGNPEYWGEVERTVRNHLIESQVQDASWLRCDSSKPDTDQFTWRDIDKRMIGGYAGWSSPNHIFAACETLPWGGPELRGKIRAFQNCCGGSGTHAFFIAWKNAARYENGCLNVNLHLDKLLPQAEIRSYQPYQGLLTIQMKASCKVKVRIPEFVNSEEMKVEPNITGVKTRGNFLDLGHRQAGETIRITYPLPVYQEEISIGNPGFRQYHYRVTWKGDTVVKMEPLGNDFETGYSDFDKKDVACFYGQHGPSELYQREQMFADATPELSSIHLDDGALDFWYVGHTD
jgi:hypothetical protein